jgi:hypothetical protein
MRRLVLTVREGKVARGGGGMGARSGGVAWHGTAHSASRTCRRIEGARKGRASHPKGRGVRNERMAKSQGWG